MGKIGGAKGIERIAQSGLGIASLDLPFMLVLLGLGVVALGFTFIAIGIRAGARKKNSFRLEQHDMNITIKVADFPPHLSWPAFEHRLRRAILHTYSPEVRTLIIAWGNVTYIGINGNHQPDEAFRICGLIEESIACSQAIE